MHYAETFFVVQTMEAATLGECLRKSCYGISRKAFVENLPQELRDIPPSSAVFIRLKDSLQRAYLFGPLFLASPPPSVAHRGAQGIWHELDIGRPGLPSFAEKLPWCFFFHPPADDRFGIVPEDDLAAERISLPPWGRIPAWVGKKLIAMATGKKELALEHLEILGVKAELSDSAEPHPQIVLTLPPHVRSEVSAGDPLIAPTFETIRGMMTKARESIKIFSPYIDATFTNLIQDIRVPVKIVTTPHRVRVYKPNPILERLSSNQSLAVRYIAEESRGAHLYQMHAKMILCDRTAAYIGSANLTDTSVYYNIELGTVVTDERSIATLHRTFDILFERFAYPADDFKKRRARARGENKMGG